MNGFERRANLIKEKIMQTTLVMMRTTDPKRIRIADISKEASVSQVTIYNYFGSKEALVREVFKNFVEKAIADFEAYMDEEHTFKEKIEHIIFQEGAAYRDFPPNLIQQLLMDDAELAAYIEHMYQEKTIPITMRIIEEGKASGEISEEVSMETVLAFIQLYMNQYEVMLAMAERSGDTDDFFRGMVHMFFYGICGKT
ncbi:TetR/AcrR family transcriptional regulator [Paenibacillus sp. N1-5-1-14]|uniref:TetR/AcrR family transcriptional regulator n=1 Tax=Paenibacillus radicibacter TaxID=2972488 RepID=UPI002158E2B3|nr:TetR/AcrR family transcriptional regulator [Paenibacillus radicibacter]MCR8642857.1 TetR/AcrR family transcriptional regulator [Paenibacillus radicibacter]